MVFYKQTKEEVLSHFNSDSEKGLSLSQVADAKIKYGENKLKDKPGIFGGFGAKKAKQTPMSFEEFDALLESIVDSPAVPPKTPTYPNANGGNVPVQPIRPFVPTVPPPTAPAGNRGNAFGETEILSEMPNKQTGEKIKAYLIIAGKSDFTKKESTEIRFYLVTDINKEDMKKAMKLSPEYDNFVVSDSFEIGTREKAEVSVMSFGLFLDKHDATLSCEDPYDYINAVKSPYEEVTDRYASALFNLKLDSKLIFNVDMTFGLK